MAITTTTQPSLNIPALTETNFNAWLVATTTAAKKALPTYGPLGGLGLLLPAAEFAAINHNEPFVPAVRPAAVSNAATTHEQATYDREQLAMNALTSAVYDSLPVATLQACPGYDHTFGHSFIPLPTMMAHVRAKHAGATTHQYHQAKAALLTPFTLGTDIDAFLATHVEAHLACARAQNPLNAIEKVDACITALGGRQGPFGFTILAYEEETGSHIGYRQFEDTPASNDIPARDGLATRVRKAAQRIPDVPAAAPAVARDYGYGAAAVNALAPNIRDEVVRALQEVLPSMLATALASAPPAKRTTETVPTSRDRLPHDVQPAGLPERNLYCWTHGLGGHTSIDCVQRAPGHDPRATITRRMGGTNRNCPK